MATAEQRIAELEAQLAAEKSKNTKKLSYKVSEKGAISFYGLRRFPITIYPTELFAILDREQELREFVEENKDKLSMRGVE